MNRITFKNRILIFAKRFIPKHISNNVVVFFMDFFKHFRLFSKKMRKNNLMLNQNNWQNHLAKVSAANGYIEDQNSYTDMPYGKASVQYSGCEIISIYNLLNSIDKNKQKPLFEHIAFFEKNGMVFNGKFGTSMKSLNKYLIDLGYDTVFSTNESEFDKIAMSTRSCILTLYNDRNDITKEIHTVNISKENNMFTVHNIYCNGYIPKPAKNLSQLLENINEGKAKGISLIGVK